MEIIRATDLGLSFKIRHDKRRTIKKTAMNILRRKKTEKFWSLRHVNFTVSEGDILGLVGRNGSGKTTLLRVIGGIYRPDEGSVEVSRTVSTLLSLSTGFQPELSGIDNIYLNGTILGLRVKEIDSLIDAIIDFSELGDFIDAPIKTYSAGMLARLGFSIAIHIKREIMLIDEILGVGDMWFREKCDKKMRALKDEGNTIILVSHNSEAIRNFCNKVIWMENGCVKAEGPCDRIMDAYLST